MDRTCPKCSRAFGCSGECIDGRAYRREHRDSCLCPECLEEALMDSIMSVFKSVNVYNTGGGYLYAASFNGELTQNLNELQRANTKMRNVCNRTRKNGTCAGDRART